MSSLRAIIIRCVVVAVLLAAPWAVHLRGTGRHRARRTQRGAPFRRHEPGALLWSGIDAWRNRDFPVVALRWAVVLVFAAVIDVVAAVLNPELTATAVDLLFALLLFVAFPLLPGIIGLSIGVLIRVLQEPRHPVQGPADYGYPVQSQWTPPYAPAEGSHRTVGE